MKTVLSIILIALASNFVRAQTAQMEWTRQMTGNSFDAGQSIALDATGNIYTTGYFSSTTDFDPGPGVFNMTSTSAEDIFISKMDGAGRLIWAKQIGGIRYQSGYSITVDAPGNVYVTGIFFGNVDFDPGPGIDSLNSAGNEDVFILKLDNDGNYIWGRRIGGVSNDFSNAIVVDNSGNVYFNGYFDGTSDFNPGAASYNLTAFGSSDVYICKLDDDGQFVWAKQLGGVSAEAAYTIALDNAGNIYSTGHFFETVDFDPGPATFNMQSSGFGDGFISKLNNNGGFIWAKRLGGMNTASLTRCNFIKLDNNGNFYTTGYFEGDVDFDPGAGSSTLSSVDGEDIFLAKYSLDGSLIWARQMGGPSFQKGVAIDVDNSGNVYTTGHFDGVMDFDPGPGVYSITARGNADAFVSKYTATGAFVWTARSGGPLFEGGYAVRLDGSGNIYVIGMFHGTTDFDPGSGTFNLTAAGASEIFIQKLKHCPASAVYTTLAVNACTAYTLNNQTYDSSGSYVQSILNSMGCDSVVITLELSITRIYANATVAICEGQSYYTGGDYQTSSGTYTDHLLTPAGCDSILTTYLTVLPAPTPALGQDGNRCSDAAIILSPGFFSAYEWQDGSTSSQIITSNPGTYWVKVTDANNCTAIDTVRIFSIDSIPKQFLPADKNICVGNSVQISLPGYKNYLWNTGETSASVRLLNFGIYSLKVTDFNDCPGMDSISIQNAGCIPVSTPNAFTPNKDGINDLFKPTITQEIVEYRFTVLNRFGQKLYETKSYGNGWDGSFKGKDQPVGTYVYQLYIRNIRGYVTEEKGSFILIR